MITLKNIKEVEPRTTEQLNLQKAIKARFFADEDGRDWYESQKLFSPDTIKIAYDINNVVVMVEKDISAIYPENVSVTEVSDTTANRRADNTGKWQCIDGNIVPRVYTDEELQSQASKQKQQRIKDATDSISVWKTKLLMGRNLTDEESKKLNAWMDYIDAVEAIDISAAPDIQWPEVADVA